MALYKHSSGYYTTAYADKYCCWVTFIDRSGRKFTKYFLSTGAANRAVAAWRNKGGKIYDRDFTG